MLERKRGTVVVVMAASVRSGRLRMELWHVKGVERQVG